MNRGETEGQMTGEAEDSGDHSPDEIESEHITDEAAQRRGHCTHSVWNTRHSICFCLSHVVFSLKVSTTQTKKIIRIVMVIIIH